jgi:hypothetical protein
MCATDQPTVIETLQVFDRFQRSMCSRLFVVDVLSAVSAQSRFAPVRIVQLHADQFYNHNKLHRIRHLPE